MAPIALHADRILTPFEDISQGTLVIQGGKIVSVGPRSTVNVPRGAKELNYAGRTIIPGFVDVHLHGAAGHDVMEGDAQALEHIASAAARHGTTSFLATTVTAGKEQSCRSISEIARFILDAGPQPVRELSAEIVGIHFEGPFISRVRRGVHPEKHLVAPTPEIFRRMLQAAQGTALIMTIAPELPGALLLVAEARKAGIIVSLGHTDATYDQAQAAIAAGARQATHVFNAMRPFSHRETGVLGAVLTSPDVRCELIADGVHVDEPAMRMLTALKGVHGVILVSDGTAATGMADGRYPLGGLEMNVAGGVCRDDAGRLCGSTLTLDRAVRNMVALGTPLQDAVRMATANPAQQIGLGHRKGVLAAGADADLVLLDENLEVSGVMTRGAGLE